MTVITPYQKRIAETILQYRPDINPAIKNEALISAVSLNRIGFVEIFLQNNTDINMKSTDQYEEGETALIMAAKSKSYNGETPEKTEIVKLLLENGADVNVKDDFGKTALDYAKQFGYSNVYELLKSKLSIWKRFTIFWDSIF